MTPCATGVVKGFWSCLSHPPARVTFSMKPRPNAQLSVTLVSTSPYKVLTRTLPEYPYFRSLPWAVDLWHPTGTTVENSTTYVVNVTNTALE